VTTYVATQLFATAFDYGPDLVAVIPQQGNFQYSIQRVTISGGPQTDTVNDLLFRMYKGSVGNNEFTSISQTRSNNAQFNPPERIPAGCDVYCVWQGQAGYAGTAQVILTTDGGAW
jgi:hypothetical protein